MGWPDLAGFAGVAAILLAYGLLQAGRLDATNPRYSLLNASGAAGVIVSLVVDFNLPAFLIELFWLIISLWGWWRARRNPPRRSA